MSPGLSPFCLVPFYSAPCGIMPGGKGVFMKKNPRPAVPALALCLALLALRVVDLLFFTDPATGFVTAGPAWLRWAVPMGASVLLWLLGCLLPRDAVPHATPAQGAALLAAGAFFAVSGLTGLSDLPQALLALAAGGWCLCFGVRLLRGSVRPLPAAWCLPVLVPELWALVRQFSVVPASTARLQCTYRVLGGAAALLLLCALFKLLFAPGTPCGRLAFRCGMAALLLCTCHEAPQAVYGLAHGLCGLSRAAFSLGQGALGLCGLAMAYSSGPAQNSDKNT